MLVAAGGRAVVGGAVVGGVVVGGDAVVLGAATVVGALLVVGTPAVVDEVAADVVLVAVDDEVDVGSRGVGAVGVDEGSAAGSPSPTDPHAATSRATESMATRRSGAPAVVLDAGADDLTPR